MGVKQFSAQEFIVLFNRLYIIFCVYFLFLMWERLCIGIDRCFLFQIMSD